jgi:uncharacterized membrane protein
MMLLLAFLIGFFAGLRSLTAPAATAWAAYLGWLKLERPLSLIGSFRALLPPFFPPVRRVKSFSPRFP